MAAETKLAAVVGVVGVVVVPLAEQQTNHPSKCNTSGRPSLFSRRSKQIEATRAFQFGVGRAFGCGFANTMPDTL